MMTVDVVVRIIQFILAPAVMITSGAILVGGMQTHYGAISDRLRALSHERLEFLFLPDASLGATSGVYTGERLREIDVQVPTLLRRLLLARNAILATYLAIVCAIASMFIIAVAAITSSSGAASLALYAFLGSTAILLFGMFEMALNIRLSHQSVAYEAKRVMQLTAQS